MRSEDELRAAFAAKAAEAPRADDVLRAVRRHETRTRRRWLVPAVAAAAAAAVGVPLGLGLAGQHGDSAKSAGRAESAESSAEQNAPRAADGSLGEICRPGDVTVALRRAATGATLTVTSHGVSCALTRVPQVQWTGAPAAEPKSTAPAAQLGVLPAGATATATVQWAGSCGPSGDVVHVDWGAGPIEVHTAAESTCYGAALQPRVSPFTGLQ